MEVNRIDEGNMEICKHCGAECDLSTDDLFNSNHDAWCCDNCSEWNDYTWWWDKQYDGS
jgi:hypothetical protein